MAGDEKSLGDRVRDKASKRDKKERQKDVQAAIEEANFQLYRDEPGSHVVVANLCRDILIPEFIPNGYNDLSHYQQTDVSEETGWDWTSIEQFSNDPTAWIDRLAHHPTWARDVIEGAFNSLEEIAEFEHIVKGAMSNTEPAFGKSMQLGEHLQQFEMTLTEPHIYSDASGHPITMFCGEPGQGKSASEEASAYDRFNGGMKVIDCIDMDKWENACWDIPQKQEVLRRIRDEAGVPVDFTESDELKNPKVEILTPITEGLSREELPYNTDTEQFTIRPYSVPASHLPKSVLLKIMEADLSKQQKTTIRTAWEDVNRENDDWALDDLQEEILQREDLDESYKIRASKVLEDLARTGFIRTEDDPYALDLEAIMRDPDTITVFGQSAIGTEFGRLVAVAHLVDAIYRTRRQDGFPPCVALLRELHEITPQRNRTGLSERASKLQEAIASRVSKLFRKQRFYGIEVLCDTQYPSDAQKGVRDGITRAIAFDLNYSDLEILFEVTPSSRRAIDSCERSMSSKTGHGAVIGRSQPTVDRENIEFLSPVKFLPSPAHHYDADAPENGGLETRCRYIESEEMRRPCDVPGVNWDDTVQVSIDSSKTEPDEYDVDTNPFGYFCQEFVDDSPATEDDWVHSKTLREVYGAFADDVGAPPTQENKQRFGTQLSDHLDLIQKRDQSITYPKEGESAYLGIKLTDDAKEFL